MSNLQSECGHLEMMKSVNVSHLLFVFVSRGDDLGDLTETVWPDVYKPEQGLGDLTGKITSCFGMK
jgi:hypothetical protein